MQGKGTGLMIHETPKPTREPLGASPEDGVLQGGAANDRVVQGDHGILDGQRRAAVAASSIGSLILALSPCHRLQLVLLCSLSNCKDDL